MTACGLFVSARCVLSALALALAARSLVRLVIWPCARVSGSLPAAAWLAACAAGVKLDGLPLRFAQVKLLLSR